MLLTNTHFQNRMEQVLGCLSEGQGYDFSIPPCPPLPLAGMQAGKRAILGHTVEGSTLAAPSREGPKPQALCSLLPDPELLVSRSCVMRQRRTSPSHLLGLGHSGYIARVPGHTPTSHRECTCTPSRRRRLPPWRVFMSQIRHLRVI